MSEFRKNILSKCVPEDPIDGKLALYQVITWFQTYDHHEPVMTQFTGIYMRYPGPLLLTWNNFNPTMDI